MKYVLYTYPQYLKFISDYRTNHRYITSVLNNHPHMSSSKGLLPGMTPHKLKQLGLTGSARNIGFMLLGFSVSSSLGMDTHQRNVRRFLTQHFTPRTALVVVSDVITPYIILHLNDLYVEIPMEGMLHYINPTVYHDIDTVTRRTHHGQVDLYVFRLKPLHIDLIDQLLDYLPEKPEEPSEESSDDFHVPSFESSEFDSYGSLESL